MTRRPCTGNRPLGADPPIRCADDALVAFAAAAPCPPRSETVVLLLDRERSCSLVVRVTGTARPDPFVPIVERLTDDACPDHVDAIVVMTRRPRGGLVDHDIDRWLEASELADRRGVELVEWFVAGRDGIECPRDLLGEPQRW